MKSLVSKFALKKLNQRKWSNALSATRKEVREFTESIYDESKVIVNCETSYNSPSPSGRELERGGFPMRENRRQTALARKLRQGQTDAEKALWGRLKNNQLEGVKFRRQQPLGSYIVDFVSFERKIIIEVDGGQHNEREVEKRDEERTTWLKGRGYQVLRLWNNDVLTNMEGVLEKIEEALS